MAEEVLRKVSQAEFNEALKNHFIYQKGWEEKYRMIFRNCDFMGVQLSETDLSYADFENSDFNFLIPRKHLPWWEFYWCDLTGVNFRGAKLWSANLSMARSIKDAIFIDSEFDPRGLSQAQKKEIIVTETDYKQFLERQNKKVIKQKAEIEKRTKEIEIKDDALAQVKDERAVHMLKIFSWLQLDYTREELLWIFFAVFVFMTIFSIAETLVAIVSESFALAIFSWPLFWIFLTVFMLNMVKKGEGAPKKLGWKKIVYMLIEFLLMLGLAFVVKETLASSMRELGETICKINETRNCMKFEQFELMLLPVSLLLFSMLWFSVHQYARAKKLRIEQQNKQALIHFMQAIIANDGKVASENKIFPQLAPFFANAIIHRPFSQENYDPQLPIDELKKLADFANLFKSGVGRA